MGWAQLWYTVSIRTSRLLGVPAKFWLCTVIPALAASLIFLAGGCLWAFLILSSQAKPKGFFSGAIQLLFRCLGLDTRPLFRPGRTPPRPPDSRQPAQKQVAMIGRPPPPASGAGAQRQQHWLHREREIRLMR